MSNGSVPVGPISAQVGGRPVSFQVGGRPVTPIGGGRASFGGGRASFGGGDSSPVGKASNVLQQQATAKRAEIIRKQELQNRTRDLNVKAAALGQEQASIKTRERELQQLQSKISEAQRKPLTSQVFVNRLISEHSRKSQSLQTKSSQFNERVGKFNAEARGLSEQFQVTQAKEIRKFSPDVKLKRTKEGGLFTTFTSPETQRRRSIATQRAISGTPLREQFGLEAAEATILGSRIEKEARERALSGKMTGLPGKVALQREKLKDIERKKSFASVGSVSSLGLTVGERQAEPIIRESFEEFQKPTRKRIRLLKESGDPLSLIEAGLTTGELIGRKVFEEEEKVGTKKGLEFKREAFRGTTDFLGLQRTPLGTDEFNLFAGTREERQAKFGAAGRGITELAALELGFAGVDIGLRFARSGKGLKTFDIGQAGGIGAGKKKVSKLPKIPTIKKGDVAGRFIQPNIPTKELFADVRLGIKKGAIPEIGKFTKRKAGKFTQKGVPTKELFADVRLGIKKGAIPDITKFVKREPSRFIQKNIPTKELFADVSLGIKRKRIPEIGKFVEKKVGRESFLGIGEQNLAFRTLAKKRKVPAFDLRGLKVVEIPGKPELGGFIQLVKPKPGKFKRTPFDFGYLLETEKATITTAGLTTKPQLSIGRFVSEVKKVEKGVKVKPAPFLTLKVPGSASALAVGLPARPKGGFEEIEFTTTRTRGIEKPELKRVQDVSFGLKTEPISIRTTRRLFDTGFKTEPVSITGQKSFLDVGVRTDLGLKNEFISLIKQRQDLDTGIKVKTDTKIKTSTVTTPLQLSLTRDLTKQQEDTISIQRIIPINLAITRARTRTRIITRPIVFPKLTTTTVPIEKVKRPRIPLIPFLTLPRRQKPGETFGYQVFVRGPGKKTAKGFKSGEFIQRTKGVLSRKEALAFGQSLVAGTAKRTFRIVPTVGKRAKVRRIPKFRPEMFRVKGRTFVEKTRFAIDQPGERREITQKGIATLKGFGLTSFTKVRKKTKKRIKKPKKRKLKKKKTKKRR